MLVILVVVVISANQFEQMECDFNIHETSSSSILSALYIVISITSYLFF